VKDVFKDMRIFSDVVPLSTTRWQQHTSFSLYFNFIPFDFVNMLMTTALITFVKLFILQTNSILIWNLKSDVAHFKISVY